AVGEVEVRAQAAEAVREPHQRAAVHDPAGGAALGRPLEAAAHLVRRRRVQLDAEQRAEGHCGVQLVHADGIAATPGSSLPSRSSRAAPPPVDAQSTLSTRPISVSAWIESAPPTTVNASSFRTTASATARVPPANFGH